MNETTTNISGTITIDFSCLNCDLAFSTTKARLYCSLRCQSDAKLIRYARNVIKKGTYNQPDIREAIEMKLAHACSQAGYYNEKARSLSKEIRSQVFERDNGLCRRCAMPGNEIDHIDGDSSDLDNLQFLCSKCHIRKTRSRIKPILPEHPRYEEISERRKSLLSRIFAAAPERICYEPEGWREIQTRLRSEQWEILKRIKEDVEAKNRHIDPVEEELITQELKELAELESQLELLALQEKEERDQILTPEIVSKLEHIENEFIVKKGAVKDSIESLKDRIKDRVGDYGNSVKGSDFHAIWRRGAVRWDNKGLEEYAKTHPEILQFRIQGKGSVVINQVKKKQN